MENGQIADWQLKAKSHKRYYEPHQARLHFKASYKGNGAWCAASGNIGEWLEVSHVTQGKRLTSSGWVGGEN